MAEIRNYTMNFGPQYLAAHGVLELDGEVVVRASALSSLARAGEKNAFLVAL